MGTRWSDLCEGHVSTVISRCMNTDDSVKLPGSSTKRSRRGKSEILTRSQ
jgi:hypothetical protein